ncbi:MAG: phosphosulfolactate synthase [Clostridia bacterium]|nr:phosphosulfolactate synthase [Clostridia bacterium]
MFEKGAWQDIITLPLGLRSKKPRTKGLTMVIDKGMGLKETKDLLETSAGYIDFLKLGFGTAAFYSAEMLKKKINLAKEYNVEIYPGGTFLEVAYFQKKADQFLDRAKELGFNFLEISDGTINLELRERRNLIKKALDRGLKVLTEVGKKDSKIKVSIENLIEQVYNDLEAGAFKVIMEGRESGKNIGLYDEKGKLIENKFEQFASKLVNPDDIIWEAPLKNQQFDFIMKMGCDVNLGNIAAGEVLALEALRTGLRGDTLNLVVSYEKIKEQEMHPVLRKLVAAWSM